MPYRYSYSCPRDDIAFECDLKCKRCSATALSGQRCKRRTCIGLYFCWSHTRSLLNLKVKASNHGKGLFACKRLAKDDDVLFRKGDVVVHYNGELVNINDRVPGDNCTAPYAFDTEDAACHRGLGSLANDPRGSGRRSNVEFVEDRRGRVMLRATRTIRDGDEILVNYGNEYGFRDHLHSTRITRSKPQR